VCSALNLCGVSRAEKLGLGLHSQTLPGQISGLSLTGKFGALVMRQL